MFCEPLYRYDVIKVFSPTFVDELLQDERSKAMADINWCPEGAEG